MKLRHALVAAVLGIGVIATATTPALAAPAAPVRPALGTGAGFTPLTPVRVVDSRTGLGGPGIPFSANETRTFSVSPEVPATATSVVLNVTGINHTTSNTYLTVWQGGQPRPGTSTVNLVGQYNGGISSNLATVPIGPNGSIELYNHLAFVDVAVDLVGYYTPGSGSGYTVLTPAGRVLDTRNGIGGPPGQLGFDSTLVLDLSGTVPAGTTAVTLNLTAVGSTAETYLTAYPDGVPRPDTSSMNPGPETVANLVTVAVSPDLKVDIYNHAGALDLIGDLAGYYLPGVGSGFNVMEPNRVLDTRDGTGGLALPFGPGTIRTLGLSGVVPAGATSVLLNVTGVDASDRTYVTLWPDGAQQPVTSNLNIAPSNTIANLASVGVSVGRSVDIYNHAGATDLVADLAGFFSS